jgi:hypothetical protein
MARTVRAYCITADAVARERERVGGEVEKMDVSRVIELDRLELADLGPRDVHLRILAASAEHNVDHAALADTVNIADVRGGRIYPGNSAVGEVLEVGPLVDTFAPGDIVITHCNGEPDQFGFPLRIWAYDQPESVGWYAEEAIVGDWQILPAPLDCGLTLWEMAALPLRAPTAHHMWRRALGIFRVKVPRERLATPRGSARAAPSGGPPWRSSASPASTSASSTASPAGTTCRAFASAYATSRRGSTSISSATCFAAPCSRPASPCPPARASM